MKTTPNDEPMNTTTVRHKFKIGEAVRYKGGNDSFHNGKITGLIVRDGGEISYLMTYTFFDRTYESHMKEGEIARIYANAIADEAIKQRGGK